MLKKYNQSIQKFGRTLLLPIGVMAPVGMVMGITGAFVQSYMIERFPILGNPAINTTLVSIRSIASIVFDNIPLLFAMGVAYGMSKKDKGIAVFSSVIGYLVMLIAMNVWLNVTGNLADPDIMSQVGQIQVLGIQTLNINALGGIIAGLIAQGTTEIEEIIHIERGYEDVVEKVTALGGDMKRIIVPEGGLSRAL